jgi:hypothetical protein
MCSFLQNIIARRRGNHPPTGFAPAGGSACRLDLFFQVPRLCVGVGLTFIRTRVFPCANPPLRHHRRSIRTGGFWILFGVLALPTKPAPTSPSTFHPYGRVLVLPGGARMTKQTRPYATIDVPSVRVGFGIARRCSHDQPNPPLRDHRRSIRTGGFGFCLVCSHCQPNPPLRDHRRSIRAGGLRYYQEVLASPNKPAPTRLLTFHP